MLKSIRIGPKLYGGFGIVLVLLVALGSVAVIQLNSIGTSFSEYRTLARSTNEVGRVHANMLMTRMGVMDFVIDGDQAAIKQVFDRAEATRELIGTTRRLITDTQYLALLDEMESDLDRYTAAFGRVTEMQDRRNDLYALFLDAGPKIEAALTEIMRTADTENDAQADFQAGLALRDLLLARLNVQRFLEDNKAESAETATAKLADFGESLAVLNTALDSRNLRDLWRTADQEMQRYRTAFDDLVATITTRNDIIDNTLGVIGPRMARQTEDFKLAVIERQDTLGPQAEAAISQTQTVTLVIGVVALVAGVVAAWTIGAGITRPIQAMTQCMAQLANKNYATPIPAQDHKDEIGDMAKALQVFKETMQKADVLAAQVEEETRKRDARSQHIATLNTEFDRKVSAILEAVAGAADELQATAQTMASIAEETNSQATTVAAASEQASTNVQTVATAAEELSSSISEIGRQAQQSSDIARKAASEAQRSNEVVSGLAEAAQKIGEVVDLITDIADQTNLLALNATIEAARAGDAGKGFAVVANEVKSLASQTAKATEDIGRQIGAVQTETRTAVSAIEAISTIIREINEVTAGIASAVEEQNAATQEIARNVQQASQGTSEVSSTIVGVSEAAREAGSAAESVLKATGSLNEQSSNLRSMVERFLADVRAA
ncbi:methyl-accepting chemotaxis protein [uncultured Rhodospira sp.]|mgnify:CR=1 FL=1|uniref:HAMP domain-containing methyl-accepting chemotaxis protein n=1 Tax=uncultured Rhodospira sp. TaxID=1936189 RepID=UPI002638F553|nr:methyl-accepting chemotaxis protein [uncultured Rhodospira sp.]